MSDNKEIVRRIYDEVLNKRDLDLLDELVRPDYIEHDPLPGQSEGIPGMKQRYSMLFAGLDPQFTIEDMIAEGDQVVTKKTFTGTHTGEFSGIPPTGNRVSIQYVDIMRVLDGQIVEHWLSMDQLSFMQQLGVVPQ
jgi:predicted ester cyclase